MRLRQWFTIFFIPVIPLKRLGTHIECSRCRSAFTEAVLDAPTLAMFEYHQGLANRAAVAHHASLARPVDSRVEDVALHAPVDRCRRPVRLRPGVRFNPPPAWTVPAGFDPRRGHLADPAWPTPPEGWSFWVADPTVGREAAVLPSATLPRGRLESGERRRLTIALACVVVVVAFVFWGVSMSDSGEVRAGIGSCWTEGDDWVNQVPCDSARAASVAEREVSTPEQCPPGPAGYLEVGETVLCLRSLD